MKEIAKKGKRDCKNNFDGYKAIFPKKLLRKPRYITNINIKIIHVVFSEYRGQ